LTVPAAALGALLAREASASLPPPLLAAALRAARPLKTLALSAQVASLAEGTLKMMLLSKLNRMVVPLLAALVVAAGWAFAARVSARATDQGEAAVLRTEEGPRAPAAKAGADGRRGSPSEAEFVFLAADEGKTVSLVVAGTSAPVLKLPVTADVRVLDRGRSVGMKGLLPGTRVHIRMGPGNAAVEEIRAAREEYVVPVLRDAKDLKKVGPPSEAEVLRALPPGAPGVPGVYHVLRDDVVVVKERLAYKADPPRFFPLVGRAQLHQFHWKCTVYYREVVEASYPFLFRLSRPRVAVVYIDKSYLVREK
jgi:hypothetical protein